MPDRPTQMAPYIDGRLKQDIDDTIRRIAAEVALLP
jgi:hypothetical protein